MALAFDIPNQLPQATKKSKELFGLSVIEYLNFDQRSGHDTLDQKVLFKGHIDLTEIWPSSGFLVI